LRESNQTTLPFIPVGFFSVKVGWHISGAIKIALTGYYAKLTRNQRNDNVATKATPNQNTDAATNKPASLNCFWNASAVG